MTGSKSFVTIADLSKDKILYLINMAQEFEKNTNRKILDGKIVATLFLNHLHEPASVLKQLPIA